ncbi:imidazole glycerol phosphate synthase subunit HisH [Synechococcus moorigangaii CMS01]|nr:imidazole glycerol phosphate synthase subunit HisH [Synechococcus moorigangaii CMS01]
MKRVAIINYGMGNLQSVINAVELLGADPHIVSNSHQLNDCDRVIVPGVGAFPKALSKLKSAGLLEALENERSAGKPILGICLGMQLFCSTSEEGGLNKGLNWIDAAVKCFPSHSDIKIPHIGWNDVEIIQKHRLVKGLQNHSDFYFVHSFYVDCSNPSDVLLQGEYGLKYCAAFVKENVIGVQFHPEKSQAAGLDLLKNFLEWDPC